MRCGVLRQTLDHVGPDSSLIFSFGLDDVLKRLGGARAVAWDAHPPLDQIADALIADFRAPVALH